MPKIFAEAKRLLQKKRRQVIQGDLPEDEKRIFLLPGVSYPELKALRRLIVCAHAMSLMDPLIQSSSGDELIAQAGGADKLYSMKHFPDIPQFSLPDIPNVAALEKQRAFFEKKILTESHPRTFEGHSKIVDGNYQVACFPRIDDPERPSYIADAAQMIVSAISMANEIPNAAFVEQDYDYKDQKCAALLIPNGQFEKLYEAEFGTRRKGNGNGNGNGRGDGKGGRGR